MAPATRQDRDADVVSVDLVPKGPPPKASEVSYAALVEWVTVAMVETSKSTRACALARGDRCRVLPHGLPVTVVAATCVHEVAELAVAAGPVMAARTTVGRST